MYILYIRPASNTVRGAYCDCDGRCMSWCWLAVRWSLHGWIVSWNVTTVYGTSEACIVTSQQRGNLPINSVAPFSPPRLTLAWDLGPHFWDPFRPLLSLEWMKIDTSNLVRVWVMASITQQQINCHEKSGMGYVTSFKIFWTLYFL